jgi:thiol:disulfide interchange protein DsbA
VEPSAAGAVIALAPSGAARTLITAQKETAMHSTRRRIVLAAALLPAMPVAHAQPKTPVALKDYREVTPRQPVDSGNKIEALEFFQYSCPHCFTFTPDLEAWRKRRAADVDYKRVPINWDDSTVNHTKTYYTLEAMGLVDKLHEKFFALIHRERRRMLDPKEIADFMAANGVDRAQWLSNFNSFAVNTKVTRAGQVWRNYKIDGTPMVGIDGRYVTAPSMAGSREGAILVMDYLVDLSRRERGSPAKK